MAGPLFRGSGGHIDVFAAAEAIMQSLGTHNRLNRSQFHTYIDQLMENMTQEECTKFLGFLITNVKVNPTP